MGGIVSSIMGGGDSSSSAPAVPNYNQAAAATQQSSMYNQNNPYGSLNYQQTGTDQYGNPTWTQNQTAAPGLQNAITNTQNTVSNQQYNPFQAQGLPSTGINPGQTYSDAIMQRLAPQQAQAAELNTSSLANQGIVPGTQAYDNAMRTFQQGQNDQLTSAIVGGMNTGLQANQQAYGQQANTYGINSTTPYNQANAVKSLSTPNFANTPAGANYNAGAQNTYNAQLANYNAQLAQQQNTNSGLFGLGAAGLMSPTGTFGGLFGAGAGTATAGEAGTAISSLGGLGAMSDIRTKENIELVGYLPNGLPVYDYDYKPEFKDHELAGHGRFRGVMAQDVEKVIPKAVMTMLNGYMAVNYGVLNG